MVNDQLLVYVGQQLSLGVSRETIIANLKSQGWTDADLNEAFLAIVPAPVAAPLPNSSVGPSATVTQNVSPTQTGFSNKLLKGKKIYSAILILFLFVIAGGGAYAYYSGVFVSLPSLTSKAIDSARATKTGNYDTTITIDFSEMKDVTSGLSQILSGNITSKQLSITAKGSYDITDSNNTKSSSVISVNVGSLFLEGELRIINNIFYAELTKAPILGFFPTLASYQNKWYSFPYKSENGQIASNPVTTFSGINPNLTDKLSVDQKEHIYQLSRDGHFIKTVKRFSMETISGESSYHFSFVLDREGIDAYLKSLKEYVNTVGKNDSALSAFDPTTFTKSLNQLKDFQGEIWIGRNDKLPYKFIMNFGVQPDTAKSEQLKVKIIGVFSSWNQPVSIVAPAESISFADLVSASLGDAKQKGKEASIKANLANTRAQAELFYDSHGNSYSGFCLSSELKTMKGHIENDGGGTDFFCKDRAQAYAVAAKFPQGTGNWCVDSTGSSKATTILPSSTVCPAK